MTTQEKRKNPYEIELPQSTMDFFDWFSTPEIQKFYTRKQREDNVETWTKKHSDKSEKWSKI